MSWQIRSVKCISALWMTFHFATTAIANQEMGIDSHQTNPAPLDRSRIYSFVDMQFKGRVYTLDSKTNLDLGFSDFNISSIDPKYILTVLKYWRQVPQGPKMPIWSHQVVRKNLDLRVLPSSPQGGLLAVDLTEMYNHKYAVGTAILEFHILPHDSFPCQGGLKIQIEFPACKSSRIRVLEVQSKDQSFWCRNNEDSNAPVYVTPVQKGAEHY